MNVNPSKERNFYTQVQQFAARVLCIVWLLVSGSPESALATPKRQMVPATTTSPGDPSIVSTPSTPLPGGILQLPPDSPGSFWGDSAGSTPSTDAGLQRAHGLRARTLDKLVGRFWGPRPQETPRTLAGPVAEGDEADSSSSQHPALAPSDAIITSSPATPSALEERIHERARVRGFVFEHQYEGKYARPLSLMAGDVSSMAGVKGVAQLLRLLGEEQEIIGLQHLLLQLRVIHEWRCIASKQEVERGMAELEDEFHVLTSLEQWFVKAFNHLRRGSCWHASTGQKLLGLLKDSLQSFGSVASHVPDLFQLLRSVAKDDSLAVRKAALSTLVDPSASWAPASLSIIRELLEDEDPYVGRATLRTLLSLGKWCPAWTADALDLIEADLVDGHFYVRKGALETLSPLLQVAPEHAEAALQSIQTALQDKEGSVRSAALRALSSLLQVAPGHAATALEIMQKALQAGDGAVRSAALGVLSPLLQVAPEHAEAALQSIQTALEDKEGSVRSAALRALSSLLQVAPGHAATALEIMQKALQAGDGAVRSAALGVLSPLLQVVPEHAEAALQSIQTTLEDKEGSVRSAALRALSSLLQVAPGHAATALEIMQKALQAGDGAVRSAALGVLSPLLQVAPEHAEAALQSIQTALEDKEGSVRSAALRALSSLLQVAPNRAQAALGIIQTALQDQEVSVLVAALRTLSPLLQVAPEHAEAALGIIRSALQGRSQGVGEASFGALSTLAQAAPRQYQAVFERIQTALQDGPWRICLAALKTLVALIQVAPDQSEAVFKIIRALLEDKDPDIRQMPLDVLPKLAQVAPSWTQYALQLTLSAFQDTQGNVRKAAFRVLERASLEQLLECYWNTLDARLIPYMTPRLYHMPLVVNHSVGDDYQQVILYLTGGAFCQWIRPKPAIDRFVALVKDEASQMASWILSDKIGQRAWERYYGAVGEEPALPADIEEMMDSPCPFWEGKRVKDTHLLALIPSRVGGQPLTLDYLGELIKSPKGGGHATHYFDRVLQAIGSQSPESSYWVLMTRDVLEGSRNKTYKDQCALVADHANRTGLPYEVPKALEAAVVVLLHHVRSGERLYSDNPYTYTRCQEKVQKYQLVVGGFSSGGLYGFFSFYDVISTLGVAGLRKF